MELEQPPVLSVSSDSVIKQSKDIYSFIFISVKGNT